MVSYSVTVGRIPTDEFIPGETEVRYIPNLDLNAAEKNVGNKPGVSRTLAATSAFGITVVTSTLVENVDYVNTIPDFRGAGVTIVRNCRFVMNTGYTSTDSILAHVRTLNGSTVTEVIFEDCEFHNRGQRPLNGVAGRNTTMRRCVTTGYVDSIRCLPAGSGSAPASYGFKTEDCWFGDFAWWRTASQNNDVHSSSLQVHADGDQVQTTLGTTHTNPTFAMYVSEWVGTGTPNCGSDRGNPMVAPYITTQATMEEWRATWCSTPTYAPESPDGKSHTLPNGAEGCSVAGLMVNRAPVTVTGGHFYGGFIPVNASDTNLPNPSVPLTIARATFHNDMKNGPGARSTDPTIKGYAIGIRAGRTYNIATSGSERNVWPDGTTVTLTAIA